MADNAIETADAVKDIEQVQEPQQEQQFVAAGNDTVGKFAVFAELLDWSDSLKTPAYYDNNGNNGIVLVDLSPGAKEAWENAGKMNKHPSEAAVDMLIVTEQRRGHKFQKRHTKLNGTDVWFAEDAQGDNEYGLFYSLWYVLTEDKFIYINVSGKTKEQYEALRDVFASTYKLS